MQRTESGLSFSQGGLWISPAIDSGMAGMIWDRANVLAAMKKTDCLRLTVIASDDSFISHNNQKIPIEKALAELICGKSELLSDMAALSFVNPTAIPLHRLRGRYLWFAAEFFPESGNTITVESITVSYPYNSYMQALPEIFTKLDNGSLADLLAMFKLITDETDYEITHFGEELNPDTATGEELERLLSWQGIGVTAIWEESAMRKLLRESARLTRLKGTEEAISELFEILLGKAPVIVTDSADYSFSVKVEYDCVPSGRHHAELLRLLEDFSPAGVVPHLELWRSGTGRIDGGIVLSDDDFGSGFVL